MEPMSQIYMFTILMIILHGEDEEEGEDVEDGEEAVGHPSSPDMFASKYEDSIHDMFQKLWTLFLMTFCFILNKLMFCLLFLLYA